MNKHEKEILESHLLLTAQIAGGLTEVYNILMEEFFDQDYKDPAVLAHDFQHYKKIACAVEALIRSVQTDLTNLLNP